jgi:hypothetical protein
VERVKASWTVGIPSLDNKEVSNTLLFDLVLSDVSGVSKLQWPLAF